MPSVAINTRSRIWEVLIHEKNRALRALIFSAPAGRARTLHELGAFGPYGWPSATHCPHLPK